MESITSIEKIKNPVFAAIVGFFLGIYIGWHYATNIYEERIKLHKERNGELEHQVAVRNKTIEEKDIELKNLYSKMFSNSSIKPTSQREAEAELEKLIAYLDVEIKKKKVELAINADPWCILETILWGLVEKD